jgi:effector-binding domain-containing protein
MESFRMNCPRFFRIAMVALIPLAALSMNIAGALAQAPPPAASPPAAPATPAPETPAPAAPATPAPATPPPAAEAPATAPPVQTADPFGEEITLAPKKVVMVKGKGNWDSAFETVVSSFKALSALLDKQGIKPAGNMMFEYWSDGDVDEFTFQVEIPVDQEPKNLGKNMSIGKSFEGRTLKFVHRGAYDNMDNTYEAISNHLEDKRLEAKEPFIEEYVTDPSKTAEDKLVINVYMPLK